MTASALPCDTLSKDARSDSQLQLDIRVIMGRSAFAALWRVNLVKAVLGWLVLFALLGVAW